MKLCWVRCVIPFCNFSLYFFLPEVFSFYSETVPIDVLVAQECILVSLIYWKMSAYPENHLNLFAHVLEDLWRCHIKCSILRLTRGAGKELIPFSFFLWLSKIKTLYMLMHLSIAHPFVFALLVHEDRGREHTAEVRCHSTISVQCVFIH